MSFILEQLKYVLVGAISIATAVAVFLFVVFLAQGLHNQLGEIAGASVIVIACYIVGRMALNEKDKK